MTELLQPVQESQESSTAREAEIVSESRRFQPRNVIATGLAVATVAGGAAAAYKYDGVDAVHDGIEYIADQGVTATPQVSSSGTEALININDVLRDSGAYVLAGGLLAAGGLALRRRRSDSLAATKEYINDTKYKGVVPKIFAATVIGSVAVASGLGDTAGKGANEPVNFLVSSVTKSDPGASAPSIIMQTNRTKPFNHSEVSKTDLDRLQTSLQTEPILQPAETKPIYTIQTTPTDAFALKTPRAQSHVVPFTFQLGDAFNPNRRNNPSSAPIVAYPNEVIKDTLGVNLADSGEGCDDNSVIVGKQLGAKKGDTIEVEGEQVKVAGTIDSKPGLDRVEVIGSLEQLDGCIFGKDTYSGALVTGDQSLDQLRTRMDELGIGGKANSVEHVVESYKDFWDRSVKPPEMQLILLVVGLGMAGTAFMRRSDILSRRKEMATMIANGVSRKQLAKAEDIRSFTTGLQAAAYGAIPMVGLDAMTNSSQFGIEQAADIRSLGAGYAAFLAVNGIGSLTARRSIKKIDVVEELRN